MPTSESSRVFPAAGKISPGAGVRADHPAGTPDGAAPAASADANPRPPAETPRAYQERVDSGEIGPDTAFAGFY